MKIMFSYAVVLIITYGMMMFFRVSSPYAYVLAFFFIAYLYHSAKRNRERMNFIDDYKIPAPIIDKFHTHYPELNEAEIEKVISGLKDYFRCLVEKNTYIAMPSKVVDMLWHEFVLNTREYKIFCDHAFGKFLHHIPDPPQTDFSEKKAGLTHIWRYTCKQEGIDSVNPYKLPLLFGIDSELSIQNGNLYDMQKAGEDWGFNPNSDSDCSDYTGGSSSSSSGDGGGWWSDFSGGDSGGGGGDGGGCGGGG